LKIKVNYPTQAKRGLEWGTPVVLGFVVEMEKAELLAPPDG
jgi:hypothetical protein